MTLEMHQFIKMQRGGGRLRRTWGHLGCTPPKDKATFRVKGTVYKTELMYVALNIILICEMRLYGILKQ